MRYTARGVQSLVRLAWCTLVWECWPSPSRQKIAAVVEELAQARARRRNES